MPATLSTLHATKQSPARLLLRQRLGDWDEQIRPENRHELANVRKEDLHVLAIGLWKLRPARLVLLEREPADLGGLEEKPALQVSHVCLSEILVLADKDDRRDPKFFRLVLFQAVTNDLCLANVGTRRSGDGIGTRENVNACLVKLFALKQLVQLCSWRCYCLACPI